jgi:biopolymer transport protein ExbD
MSANFGSDSGGDSQDFDINLAPIIDCFVVLITFMLVSASFLSVGLLDAGVSAGSPSTTQAPPPVQIEIELKSNRLLEIKVSGKESRNLQINGIPAKTPTVDSQNEWDLITLATKLGELKTAWPTAQGLTLKASDTVDYQSVVLVMDQVRKTHPAVLLGGF